MANTEVFLADEPFDPAEEQDLFVNSVEAGAVAVFCGFVRYTEDGRSIDEMHVEHYPGMTEKCLENIAGTVAQKHGLIGALVIHRTGSVEAGEPIVLVCTASEHRREALLACAQIMDYVKTGAPFWKKVSGPDGSAWIEANKRDEEAAASWNR